MRLKLGQPEVTNETNILEIEVPPELRIKIPSGIAAVDYMLSKSGVTPSTSAFVTGTPGSGKTTFMLQMANAITSSGNIAFYDMAEESLYQIRQTVERLGLVHGFISGYDTSLPDIIKKANEIRLANSDKKVFLFIDSLQCIDVPREPGIRGRGLGKTDKQVKIIETLTEWAKETYNMVFTIGHSTKKGDYAGSSSIKHIIDLHMHLGPDTDRKSETYGELTVKILKNRFGNLGNYPYTIDEKGVSFAQIKEAEAESLAAVIVERVHMI